MIGDFVSALIRAFVGPCVERLSFRLLGGNALQRITRRTANNAIKITHDTATNAVRLIDSRAADALLIMDARSGEVTKSIGVVSDEMASAVFAMRQAIVDSFASLSRIFDVVSALVVAFSIVNFGTLSTMGALTFIAFTIAVHRFQNERRAQLLPQPPPLAAEEESSTPKSPSASWTVANLKLLGGAQVTKTSTTPQLVDVDMPGGHIGDVVMLENAASSPFALSLVEHSWRAVEAHCNSLNNNGKCSMTVSVNGATGHGKTTLLRMLRVAPEPPKPIDVVPGNANEPSSAMCSNTLGIDLFWMRERGVVTWRDAGVVVLDIEGADGTGKPANVNRISEHATMLSHAGHTVVRAVTSFYRVAVGGGFGGGGGNVEAATAAEKQYIEKRKQVTDTLLPHVVYQFSDVVLVVGNDPLKSGSYAARCKKLLKLATGDRLAAPALIIVANMCTPHHLLCRDADDGRLRPYTVDELTTQYLATHDPDNSFGTAFNTVRFVGFPNVDMVNKWASESMPTAALADAQLRALQHEIDAALTRQVLLRTEALTNFTTGVWSVLFERAVMSCRIDQPLPSVRDMLHRLLMERAEGAMQRVLQMAALDVQFVRHCTVSPSSSSGRCCSPSHSPHERQLFYELVSDGAMLTVALHVAIRSLNDSAGRADVNALINTFSKRLFADMHRQLWDSAPCSHRYGGKSFGANAVVRFAEHQQPIYCFGRRNHDSNAHHSTRYLFGSRDDDNWFDKVTFNMSWMLAVLRLAEVDGRQAIWSDTCDGGGTVTFQPTPPAGGGQSRWHDESRSREIAKQEFSNRLRFLLPSGLAANTDAQLRARCAALVSFVDTSESPTAPSWLKTVDWCLACTHDVTPARSVQYACKHRYCVPCIDALRAHPSVPVYGNVGWRGAARNGTVQFGDTSQQSACPVICTSSFRQH